LRVRGEFVTYPFLYTSLYTSRALSGSVKYPKKSVPIIFSCESPIMSADALFRSVIFPFRLIVKRGSRLASMRLLAYRDFSVFTFYNFLSMIRLIPYVFNRVSLSALEVSEL
jgi:hypothetical protein